jgi:hypothetical protein
VGRTEHNFANVAPFIDWIFGTHHCPEGPETYPLGLHERLPRGYAVQLVRPFVLLARRRSAVVNVRPVERFAQPSERQRSEHEPEVA